MAENAAPLERAFGVTNIKSHIPLILDLDDHNYDAWRELFLTHCLTFDVLGHLDGTLVANGANDVPWQKRDGLVKLWIYGTLAQPLFRSSFAAGGTARDVWLRIENQFRNNKEARAIQLDNEIRTTEIGDQTIQAVHFLHTGVIPGFFSNRLKTNNVLLNQHRFAKLSDYGLSIVSEATRHNTEIAKSWQMSRLEDDVYSFGLILLQSIVGPSVSAREEAFLRDELTSLESEEGRRRMVNPTVLATCRNGSLIRVISLMNKCVSPESLSRPSFEDILWNLQYASQLQAEDGDQY